VVRYDPTPLECECDHPWDSGYETCDRCGKRLPPSILIDLARKPVVV
jgi:hypothetical protein